MDGFFKGRPVKLSKIPIEYPGESYYLTMQYDDSFRSHLESGKKWKNYHGHRYAEYFPMDFDGYNSLEECKEMVISFLEDLSIEHDFDLRCLLIYWSGNKGFHICIPSILFNITPLKNLESKFKLLFNRLISGHPIEHSDYLDSSIYSRNSWFRIPNSLNLKSNLYKIPLTWAEFKSKSINEIRVLAKNPRYINNTFPVSEIKPNDGLSQIWQECLFQASPNSGVDVEQLLTTGIDEGTRSNTAFLIIRVLRDQGVSEAEIRNRITGWNMLNRPPISKSGWPDSQIESTLKYQGIPTFRRDCLGLRALLRDHLIFRTNLFSNAEYMCVISLIAHTNSVEKKWNGVTVKPGQVIATHWSLGGHAHPRKVKRPETVARNTLKKLIKEGVLVKVAQLKGNLGNLYEWQGEFAEVFQYSVDHPFTSPPQITPTTAVTHTVSVNYDDTLKNLITPIDHLIMSSTKNFSPLLSLSEAI